MFCFPFCEIKFCPNKGTKFHLCREREKKLCRVSCSPVNTEMSGIVLFT